MVEAIMGTVVRVRYTEGMVRTAVWLFMRRAVLWLPGIAVVVVGLASQPGW